MYVKTLTLSKPVTCDVYIKYDANYSIPCALCRMTFSKQM